MVHAGAADIVVGATGCDVVTNVIEAEVLEERRSCVDERESNVIQKVYHVLHYPSGSNVAAVRV